MIAFATVVQAFDFVTRAVDAQRVIWLEGRHLPQRIDISDMG